MADVVALRGDTVANDARQALLDVVAQSFDKYLADNGDEPEGIAYVLGRSDGHFRTGWLMRGKAEPVCTMFLAAAGTALLGEVIGTRTEAS